MKFSKVLESGETYQIWCSNTAGSPGTLLATNQSSTTFNLTNDQQYRYITIEAPNGFSSVLLDNLNVADPGSTPTPEPGSAALVLLGLASVAAIGILAKK